MAMAIGHFVTVRVFALGHFVTVRAFAQGHFVTVRAFAQGHEVTVSMNVVKPTAVRPTSAQAPFQDAGHFVTV